MYYFVAIPNLATAVAWYGLIGKANRRTRNTVFPFWRWWKNGFALIHNVISDMIFYPGVIPSFQVSKTTPYIEVWGPRVYQSEYKFLPLCSVLNFSIQQLA